MYLYGDSVVSAAGYSAQHPLRYLLVIFVLLAVQQGAAAGKVRLLLLPRRNTSITANIMLDRAPCAGPSKSVHVKAMQPKKVPFHRCAAQCGTVLHTVQNKCMCR
ncbi:hypothetical protein E2C01_096363 [Portunus trituberculatus]|uniref:Uncharacterized protein n=1 Tax=Portunus trituberculatus TaxID=210409 RepID=A0A5B7K6N4_PORTR|nr:hypothetical protein [Portunus trituberculatus]